MKILVFASIVSLAGTLPAAAMTYFLRSDLGVHGFQRTCEYSNGQTYAVNSTELCPMSIEDNPVANGTGFLQGEYRDGPTKVCVYDVLGSQKALRLNVTEICPLTSRF